MKKLESAVLKSSWDSVGTQNESRRDLLGDTCCFDLPSEQQTVKVIETRTMEENKANGDEKPAQEYALQNNYRDLYLSSQRRVYWALVLVVFGLMFGGILIFGIWYRLWR